MILDAQDHPSPYTGFALLEGDTPAVEASATSDEHGEPAEGKADICMCVDLFEEVGS